MRNHAHLSGGGIYNSGWVYLQDSTINNNIAHNGVGGGIYIQAGRVDIAYSTINDNETIHGRGPGIVNGSIYHDVLGTGQWTKSGGGLNIYNSTISDNKYRNTPEHRQFPYDFFNAHAGGLVNDGDGEVWLKSVTITGNKASFDPGGVYNRGQYLVGGAVFAESKFYFSNTIIAVNGSNDCWGRLVSMGGNLAGNQCEAVPPEKWDSNWPPRIGDKTTTEPYTIFVGGTSPRLADNGGTSCTVALAPGSPAIDAAWTGKPGEHPFACELYDQRWVTRDSATTGRCDMGAFEFNGPISPSGLGCKYSAAQ
jgi:hypothetical protein